jgi:cell division septum initiation protein DivIVA
LNLQQSRVGQAATRLDDVRRELEGLTSHARDLVQQAGFLEARLAEETDAVKRHEIEQAQRHAKLEAERATAQEQRVRTREADVFQAFQTEESRGTDLISRLEQLIKK